MLRGVLKVVGGARGRLGLSGVVLLRFVIVLGCLEETETIPEGKQKGATIDSKMGSRGCKIDSRMGSRGSKIDPQRGSGRGLGGSWRQTVFGNPPGGCLGPIWGPFRGPLGGGLGVHAGLFWRL